MVHDRASQRARDVVRLGEGLLPPAIGRRNTEVWGLGVRQNSNCYLEPKLLPYRNSKRSGTQTPPNSIHDEKENNKLHQQQQQQTEPLSRALTRICRTPVWFKFAGAWNARKHMHLGTGRELRKTERLRRANLGKSEISLRVNRHEKRWGRGGRLPDVDEGEGEP